MEIKVTRGVMERLLHQAAVTAPKECCGLLLGHAATVMEAAPAANVADDPMLYFEIDPAALFAAYKAARNGGQDVIGYYHSHPNGHPLPSAVDCEHASGDGRVWAIIAGGVVRFYRDGDGGFAQLSYSVIAE